MRISNIIVTAVLVVLAILLVVIGIHDDAKHEATDQADTSSGSMPVHATVAPASPSPAARP